jgi:hypothetical protein
MSLHAGELLVREIAPRIRSSLTGSVSQVGADDIGELVQNGIAVAAGLLVSAEARGKKVSAGNISYYAVKLLRQGRRSGGQSKTDVMHPATQLAGRCSLVPFDAPLTSEADGEEFMCLHDVLAAKSEDPATSATRRLDLGQMTECLDTTAREILHCLADGRDLTTLVAKLRRSRSGLQMRQDALGRLCERASGRGHSDRGAAVAPMER